MTKRNEAESWIRGILGETDDEHFHSAVRIHLDLHDLDPTLRVRPKPTAQKFFIDRATEVLGQDTVERLRQAHDTLPPHPIDPAEG